MRKEIQSIRLVKVLLMGKHRDPTPAQTAHNQDMGDRIISSVAGARTLRQNSVCVPELGVDK